VVIFVTSYACFSAVWRHTSTQLNTQHKLLNVSYLSPRELTKFWRYSHTCFGKFHRSLLRKSI